MTKEDFNKLKAELLDKGYSKYGKSIMRHEDFSYGKSFLKDKNIFEEDRSCYQIILYIYEKFTYGFAYGDDYGIEIEISISRTADEIMNFTLPWREGESLEEVESTASEFFNWICVMWPFPRESKE